MRVDRIVAELAEAHPGCRIVRLPDTDPTEIVCELGAVADGPAAAQAIAVIERSAAHLHRLTHETYRVLRGEGVLHLDDHDIPLRTGEVVQIEAGRIHWVEGDEVWLMVESRPPWTPEDHILVE